MNILFLADIVPYPPNTGIKIRTFNTLKELHGHGHKVYLIAFNHKIFINDLETKEQYRAELSKYCEETHILEIPSEETGFSRNLLLLKALFSTLPYRVLRYWTSECVQLIKDIRRHTQLDFAHLDKTEFYCYEPQLRGMPLAATNHNVESDLMRQRAKKETSFLRRFFAYLQFIRTRKYEKHALGRVNGYITCSQTDADFFIEELGVDTPYKVIPNGVDCTHYSPLDTQEKNQVLIIGAQNKASTANYDATVFFMEEIWPLISKEESSLVLRIVGRNPDPSIAKYAEELENVMVEGFVEDERMEFAQAKALIVPLRVGGGSRLKILTAMGMARPVISTTKGAEGIEYTDGEDIIIADDPESFAEAVLKVVGEDKFRSNISLKARELALEVYDWEKIGNRLDSFYSDISESFKS